MRKNKNYLKRYLFLSVAILSLYFLHRIYEIDIYKWFCNNEENKAACMITGLNYEERGDQESADYYLKRSCELGYILGCIENAKRADKIGREKVSKLYYKEACRLGDKNSCFGKEAPPLEEPR